MTKQFQNIPNIFGQEWPFPEEITNTPHNIRKIDDRNFVLEIPFPGVKEDLIEVTYTPSTLKVTVDKEPYSTDYVLVQVEGYVGVTYLFELDYCEDRTFNATYVDGMLYVHIKSNTSKDAYGKVEINSNNESDKVHFLIEDEL